MRKVIPALVILGLALGAWLLWPRDAEVPTTTVPEAAATSTTTSAPVTATEPTLGPTTSTVAGSHVVETVAEAEEILRQLWFGWFEGIYNEDEDRIREVVGSPRQVEAAIGQFGDMEFTSAPSPDGIQVSAIDLMLTSDECLVVWAEVDARDIVGSVNEGVHVFVYNAGAWKFVSQWTHREDLWANDCDVEL